MIIPLLLPLLLAHVALAHGDGDGHVLCRRCGYAVAREMDVFPADSLPMSSAARRKGGGGGGEEGAGGSPPPGAWTFTNRLGQTFELATVAATAHSNLRPVGVADPRDSFFPGYVWKNVECPICSTGLGWQFQRPHECTAGDGRPATQAGGPGAAEGAAAAGAGSGPPTGGAATTTTTTTTKQLTRDQVKTRVETLMNTLNRCADKQMGYWTAEWCNANKVSQYHLEREGAAAAAAAATGNVLRNPEYSLGKFKGQVVSMDVALMRRFHAGNVVMHAYVLQSYEGGQRCDETEAPRHTQVTVMCCRGITGNAHAERTTTFLDLFEPQVCSYDAVICLPELCQFAEFLPEVVSPSSTTQQSQEQQQQQQQSRQAASDSAVSAAIAEVCKLPVDRSAPRMFYALNMDTLVGESSPELAWVKEVKPVLGAMSSTQWM